jgi:hypothetical protein
MADASIVTAQPDRRLLGIYLNDHLAGATFGAALARRALGENRRDALGRALEIVAPQIEEDRATLLDLMRRLGIGRSEAKEILARIAELAGRLKANGRIVRSSPLSRLVELEVLIMGIQGKASLWRSLREVAGSHPELVAAELERLLERAEAQQGLLEDARAEVARGALLSGAATG